MESITTEKRICYIDEESTMLVDTCVRVTLEYHKCKTLDSALTKKNTKDMVDAMFGSLSSCGGGIEIQKIIFDVPSTDLGSFNGYETFLDKGSPPEAQRLNTES